MGPLRARETNPVLTPPRRSRQSSPSYRRSAAWDGRPEPSAPAVARPPGLSEPPRRARGEPGPAAERSGAGAAQSGPPLFRASAAGTAAARRGTAGPQVSGAPGERRRGGQRRGSVPFLSVRPGRAEGARAAPVKLAPAPAEGSRAAGPPPVPPPPPPRGRSLPAGRGSGVRGASRCWRGRGRVEGFGAGRELAEEAGGEG